MTATEGLQARYEAALMPNYGLPFAPGSTSAGPSPAPGSPRATPSPSATPGTGASGGSSSGLSLPSTTVRFSLGPAQFTIDLPASLAIRLPVLSKANAPPEWGRSHWPVARPVAASQKRIA